MNYFKVLIFIYCAGKIASTLVKVVFKQNFTYSAAFFLWFEWYSKPESHGFFKFIFDIVQTNQFQVIVVFFFLSHLRLERCVKVTNFFLKVTNFHLKTFLLSFQEFFHFRIKDSEIDLGLTLYQPKIKFLLTFYMKHN